MRALVSWVLVVLAGCGARVDEGSAGSGGGGVDAASEDAIATDAPPACPTALPTSGAACTPTMATCTYGATGLPWCRPRATCAAGAWSVVDWSCPACPSTPAVDGEPCAARGATCAFERRVCGCGYGRWTCKAIAVGCPLPGPNEGDPCPTEGQICDYGVFSTGLDAVRGLESRCVGGHFHNTFRS